MLAGHGLLGVVIEILANHQHSFAVAEALRVRERDIGCKGNIPGHFLPEVTELVARVPDVIAGGGDRVLLRAGVIAGATRHHGRANVRLTLKHSDRGVEISARPVKICRRRYLLVGRGSRLRPQQIRGGTQHQDEQRGEAEEFTRRANHADFHSKELYQTGRKFALSLRRKRPGGLHGQLSEIAKLDRWSEDLKFGLEQEIKDLDKEIRDAKRVASAAASLADKLVHQRTLKTLQTTRNQKRKDLFVTQDEVEARRNGLIADIEARMAEGQRLTPIFALRWRLL